MKKTFTFIFFSCLAAVGIAVLLTSSSGGRAFATNSGNTGAPGEGTTCVTCHGSGFSTSVSMTVQDTNGNTVSSYVPGSIYTIDFTVNSTGAVRWGYQLTSLNSSNGAIANFSNPSTNTRLVSLSNGRQYAEHAGKSTTPSFSVDWTAPVAGTGNVTFYGAGAAVDNNGGRRGDGAAVTNLTLTENVNVGIEEQELQEEFKVYPNPANEFIYIEPSTKKASNANVSILNNLGQIVSTSHLDAKTNGVQKIFIGELDKGVYFLKIDRGSEVSGQKIIIN